MVTAITTPWSGSLPVAATCCGSARSCGVPDHVLGIDGDQSAQGGERIRLLVDRVQGDQQRQHDHGDHRQSSGAIRRAGPSPMTATDDGQDEQEAPEVGRPGKVDGTSEPTVSTRATAR